MSAGVSVAGGLPLGLSSLANAAVSALQPLIPSRMSGLNVDEMQKQITADSLKSLASNGYGGFLTAAMAAGLAHFGAPAPLQDWVNWNIRDIDKNLDRA